MQCKPTVSSFISSIIYSLMLVFGAGFFTFFFWEKNHTITIIVDALTAIYTLYLLSLDITTHIRGINFDEQMITVTSPFGNKQIEWSDVKEGVLMERKNVMTRTDHLLILHGQNTRIMFDTSTLSELDEEYLLAFVRRKVSLVVKGSKPCI